jgi:hypothetical protein
MQEGFSVDRRRLCGAAAAAVATGPVGLAGLLFSERSTAMNFNVNRRLPIRPQLVHFISALRKLSLPGCAGASARPVGPRRRPSTMIPRSCRWRLSANSYAIGRPTTTGGKWRRGSTPHGGSASDAFDLVIRSMPGYGFSGQPTTTGWDLPHIARAWIVLMKRLGYTRFVVQDGDWGRTKWPNWHRRNCSAFTSTYPVLSRPRRSLRRPAANRSIRRRKTRLRAAQAFVC